MAFELQQIIQRTIRKNLFTQINDEPHFMSTSESESRSSRSENHHHQKTTAKDRRRMVQQCRTLKQKIAQFESQFKLQHRHEPKQNERAPLQREYDEYRSLKLTIRDSAAVSIQSVFRGYRARKAFRRLRVTAKDGGSSTSQQSGGPMSEKNGGNAEQHDLLMKLREQKTILKKHLRQFDLDFVAKEGRMPKKEEKEHLRPQYTEYHALKKQISDLEAQLGLAPDSPIQSRGGKESRTSDAEGFSLGTARSANSSHTQQPTRTLNGSSSIPSHSLAQPSSVNVSTSLGAAAWDEASSTNISNRGRNESISSQLRVGNDNEDDDGPISSNRRLDAQTLEKIEILRAEKRELQADLREYERQFLNMNGRAVKYVKDIAPVMDQYKKYRDLKAKLKELDGS